ncbi:ABC transporter substrate-binding protein [Pyrobaculum calidifontis]|uniref:Periplasmic binding protein n=1 Tax=Pyrobaculum calidifontis (strain DSM 21063 / JCM 11548 / VA1) TaxID=410359 RepID=A3MWC1_PYRCJ|nr:ABC transporter substrate-binding protein [Pyrobaculum calidifontis]ABO08938.1 periplasmic binding protein [Pyrobaculum calidifontis JCM 11548]
MSQKITLGLAAAALLISILAVALAWSTSAKVEEALHATGQELGALTSAVKSLNSTLASLASGVEQRLANVEREAAAAKNATAILLKAAQAPAGEVPVKYAKLFSIRYEGGYYVLRDALGRTILLAPRGAGPALTKFYVDKYKPAAVVYYPVQRAVYMSSTHVAMAYRLYKEGGDAHVLKSVVGIMWGKEYAWHLPEVAKALENGTIRDVGPASSPNYEQIAALKPDVVFVYFYPGPYGTEAVIQRLDQLKIPYAVVNEFQEGSPLGRAEWIKFIAAFYNLTDAAVKIFDGAEAKWNSLAALAREAEHRPRVAWFIIFGGVLYPAGPQVRELISLAGGRYAYSNYSRVDLEVVLKEKDVDVLVWSGYGVQSVSDILKIEPRLSELKAVAVGRLYAYSDAFYQLANAYPDQVLEELLWIIHPELAPPGNFTLFVPLR